MLGRGARPESGHVRGMGHTWYWPQLKLEFQVATHHFILILNLESDLGLAHVFPLPECHLVRRLVLVLLQYAHSSMPALRACTRQSHRMMVSLH